MHSILCRNPKIKPGDVFNRLTAIGPEFRVRYIVKGKIAPAKNATVYRCECGNIVVVGRHDALHSVIKSCGCYQKDAGRIQGLKNTTHGRRPIALYRVWCAMNNRCELPGQDRYSRYVGRGIAVCEEWKGGFVAFRDWALASGYESGLQIDRFPDKNGNYEPMNCRWVTCKENNNNRCSNRFIEWSGETKTLQQWSEDPQCVVRYGTLWQRLYKGWDFGQAMATPVNKTQADTLVA